MPAVAVRRRETCRLCGSLRVERVFEMPATPVADAYVGPERRSEPQELYPLDLYFCCDCTHVQLLDVVDPEILFRDYTYCSSLSPAFVQHFKDYAAAVVRRAAPAPGALAVDIGSNDGTLLRFFKESGMRVLGVDPAREVARRAAESGVETLVEFFTPDLARRMRTERGAAAVVTANNAFAHADDLPGIADGIRTLLAPDGVFVFEVSYVLDVLERAMFDTIYHEHLCYHAMGPMAAFLRRHGLELIEVERIATKGGSLRGYAQLAGGPRPAGDSVAGAIAAEVAKGLGRVETYRAFARRMEENRDRVKALVEDFRGRGKTLAGFGAAANCTTLMYYFDLGAALDFVVDDNQVKHGKFTPGFHLPVLPSSALYERKPDAVVLLAWTYRESILRRHQAYRDQGGRFIIPLPRLEAP